ncbi:equilibrative nucleobase transporter 1-like [Ostrea edulis]|uniref:equilibrative nucleobase transporter 1-like n=1 Tax=Ostrea edulis TaxID=37623 RepID=UPI0024AF4476|nr:equilibrative nucleobase transporter 1-like [Ostrea edulis]
MSSCCCNKRHVTFIWAAFECLFFSGVIFGWVWLTVTLRRDAYFLNLCNVTFPEDFLKDQSQNEDLQDGSRKRRPNCRTTSTTTTFPPETEYLLPFNGTQYFCDEQEDRLDLLYGIVIIVRNLLILPVGVFMDKYGTTRTRLVTVLTFITGTLMMTFSSAAFPWLLIPALVLVSLAGLLLLITNLQVANLFGEHRYTTMATFIGAYYSCSMIMACMKATNDLGVGTQTSFMFLTIAIVPILVSTIAFLPKSRIPWPLPATYGNKHMLNGGSGRAKSSRDSKNREDFAAFKNVACSSFFIWSLVWFSVQYLKEFFYDESFRSLFTRLGVEKEHINMEYSRLYSSLKLLGLPLAPVLGYLLDWRKISSYSPPRIQQMHRILILVVLSSVLALLNSLLPFIPSLPVQIAGFVLQIIERVTVLVCVCSFLTHVHFPVEHFGKYIGCHFLVASLSSLLGFAFQSLVHVHPDHNPIYVNLVQILLLVIAWGHPINIWYHCHQGLIQDASETDFGSEIPTNQKLVTEPDTPSSV